MAVTETNEVEVRYVPVWTKNDDTEEVLRLKREMAVLRKENARLNREIMLLKRKR